MIKVTETIDVVIIADTQTELLDTMNMYLNEGFNKSGKINNDPLADNYFVHLRKFEHTKL